MQEVTPEYANDKVQRVQQLDLKALSAVCTHTVDSDVVLQQ